VSLISPAIERQALKAIIKKERKKIKDIALYSSSDIIMLRVCSVTTYNEKTKWIIKEK
jgi:hypothetical protein